MPSPDIFAPFTINRVRFRSRVIRSSIGGRNAYYDGTVNDAFASKGFDILYGYRDMRAEMPEEQIEETISRFARAAVRARLAGCDGVEVTVSKGYLIHQFLNPRVNHRTDQYGGSLENRFRFLQRVANAVRRAIGPDFLFGIRISARDYNHLPWIANLFRTPR